MHHIIELSKQEGDEFLYLVRQEISNIEKDLIHATKMPTLASLLRPKLEALQSLERKLDTPIQGAAMVAEFVKQVRTIQPNLN
jgi:hypothetical protein